MQPVVIEVIAPVLGFLYHCPHCEMMSNQAGGLGEKVHNQEINEYPEEMREEYLHVSDWVREVYRTYGLRVRIKVVDPQSLVGMWKYLRYGVRTYPTFILDGEQVYIGWESAARMAGQIEALVNARREPIPAEQAG